MTLKIGYFSDLHVEFMMPDVKFAKQHHAKGMGRETFAQSLAEAYAGADVIVAAGDIGVGVDAIRFLQAAFPDKPVIHIPGNHEHYSRELHANHAEMAAEAAGSNVHFFHDGALIEIGGVMFCAATLWTDFDLLEPEVSRRYVMLDAEEAMSDYRKIRIRHQGRAGLRSSDHPRPIRPIDVRELHLDHCDAIIGAMGQAEAAGKPLVVVTHHAPCARSLMYGAEWSGKFQFQPTDPAYASHLDHMMEREDAPCIWVHGHTHVAVDYTVGNTRVLSNPKGYQLGEDTGWEWGRCVEVDSKRERRGA